MKFLALLFPLLLLPTQAPAGPFISGGRPSTFKCESAGGEASFVLFALGNFVQIAEAPAPFACQELSSSYTFECRSEVAVVRLAYQERTGLYSGTWNNLSLTCERF